MEIMLRCAVPDRPGALAALARAIAEAGGDIHAVDVVEHRDGVALDDLVVVISPGGLPTLLGRVEDVDGVKVHHAGPSRGHPGDAVARLAVGLQSVLDGAMDPAEGLRAVVGGALRADSAEVMSPVEAPHEDATTLVLPAGETVVVLRRRYRFTATERDRAIAVVRACIAAADVHRVG